MYHSEKIIFTVKEECLDADPDNTSYKYEEVDSYDLDFYLDDYSFSEDDTSGNRISINSEIINDINELIIIKGKILRICNSKYKDRIYKSVSKQLDFYHH